MHQSHPPHTPAESPDNGQTARPATEELVTLTPKEKEVLRWGALGKSSWEIAQIMRCTEATVNFHFANIRRKFKVCSRWIALRKAAEMGLLDAENV